MNFSQTGQFYGHTNETVKLAGLTLTDTEYRQKRVPWHFHQNCYFTFLLEGGMTEANKKRSYECQAGDLLFHNWDDAHYNIASDKFTRGFHLEIDNSWLERYDIKNVIDEGSIGIVDPIIKGGICNIFKEMKIAGEEQQLAIDALLIRVTGRLAGIKQVTEKRRPGWLDKVIEMIHSASGPLSLNQLSLLANVHPVHLSREFSRHTGSTFGDYIRAAKVQRAIVLLLNRQLSLTEIAFMCGFSDQSHFIRSFRQYYNTRPLKFRRLLLR